MRTGPAADFGGGAAETGDDLAKGVGAGKHLDELEADVGAREVGENKDVGPAGHAPSHFLGHGHVRIERGVDLELAVDLERQRRPRGLGAGELGGGADLHNRRVVGTALAGIAEQGNPGQLIRQMVGDHRRGDGDVGQLLRGGLGEHAAIGQEKRPIEAHFLFIPVKNHQRRSRRHILQPRNDLEKRAQCARSRHGGATDQGVDLSGREHHRCEVIAVLHHSPGLAGFEALVAPERLELPREVVEVLAPGGFDQTHAGERHVKLRGGLLDAGPFAKQNGRAHPPRHPLAGGLKDARIGALRKDDALRMALQPLDEFGQQGHSGRKMPAGAGSVNASSHSAHRAPLGVLRTC